MKRVRFVDEEKEKKKELKEKHKIDLAERWAKFKVDAAPYLQADGSYKFPSGDEDGDEQDEDELVEVLERKKRALEFGFPKTEFCAQCDGTGGDDVHGACDECICGACGSEKWECAGC
jgi:hypothetical protein